MTFERIVEVTGAFDRRDPDPSKNYGVHAMTLRFVLKGNEGAVQFVVYTPMHLPHVHDEWLAEGKSSLSTLFRPIGADIGYHAKRPQFKGHESMEGDCIYTDGPCYYDGSGLQADEFMPTFLSGGSDAVWKMLEERYATWLAANKEEG